MAKSRETPPKVKEFLDNIRNKSIRQMVKEQKEEEIQEQVKENVEEAQSTTETKAPEVPETPEKAEVVLSTPEDRRKELEEVKQAAIDAAKASNEELKAEIAKIRESDKTTKEKDAEIKELKANWTGFDKSSGKQTPKDYDEIVSESRRLAFEDFKNFYKEQKQAELEEYKKAEVAQQADKRKQQEDFDQRVATLNSRINGEMEELYAMGKLVKPKDINDPNDPAAKRVKDLFDQAARYNEKQGREGKPLVDSIAKYYFMYYQPAEEKQPPGADAPVSGNRAAPPEDGGQISYADIHNKSFRQLISEGARRLQTIRNR